MLDVFNIPELLHVLYAAINSIDEMSCQYQYTLVPSTMDIQDCNILGSKVQLVCQVFGPPNHILNVSWHRETNKANAGHTVVGLLADGEYGYKIEYDPMLVEQSWWNISIIASTLTISDVDDSDLAYFWCRADVFGFTEPRSSGIILLSKPCDLSTPQCEGRRTLPDGTILLSSGADICTDSVATPQIPDPPVCPSQPPPLVTLIHSVDITPSTSIPTCTQRSNYIAVTPSTSIPTHTQRSNHIDTTPMMSPGDNPPQSSGSQIWIYTVGGIAATIGTIALTVVLVTVVLRVRRWRRKKNHPIHVQSCTAYGKTSIQREKRDASSAATNRGTTGEVFYDTIPDVIQEKNSQPTVEEYYDDIVHERNKYRESVNKELEEYESVIDDDSESGYLEITA